MSKDISSFQGSLPDSEDAFHIAHDGQLLLTNFDVNVSVLKPQHKQIITAKLVPFLLSATKALGPGEYKLRCVGLASATGSFEGNAQLSDLRALNSANFAISVFRAQLPTNPHVAACKLVADPKPTADTAARQDVIHRHIKAHDIERKQAPFRAALFPLSAAKIHPKGSAVFHIREIYLFKFKSKSEPLPAALQRIKQAVESKAVLIFFAKRIGKIKILVESLEAFSKLVTTALGPEGKLALIVINFMIPEEIDSCYEIKNSENNHALYRMNSNGNKLNSGILDLLELMSESIATMKGVVKALKVAVGVPAKADKSIQFIEKFITDFHREAVELAKTFGPGFGEFVEIFLTMAENGVSSKAMLAPASPFVPFVFHDRSADHQVGQLALPARRNVFGVGFNEVVDLEFGGPVPNNFTDFEAQAKYKRIIVDLLEIETNPRGLFFLLKANYAFDLVVGPTNVVTD